MDKVAHYQRLILDFLSEQSKHKPINLPNVSNHVIADKENNHFQLLQIGWQEAEYIFTVVFHLDIIDGKIWLQQNITEHEVVDYLMERNVPKEDIVLGLQPPYVRAHSGFAVA
jgi:hypothetical protein